MQNRRKSGITILIPARNAASTIERAVGSAVAEHPDSILLLDHASEDATRERAKRAGGDAITILDASSCRTLAAVREMGLSELTTPYGIWLDADDEFIPGRTSRLLELIDCEKSDLAFDEAELVDQDKRLKLKELSFPPFLREQTVCRLFERSYLPFHCPAFRTDAVKRISYDPSFEACEDYDFALRAISEGLRFSFSKTQGYRYTHSANSLSRNIEGNRLWIKKALEKHTYSSVVALYDSAGLSEVARQWAIVLVATQRDDHVKALVELEKIIPTEKVLEPDGPFPVPENWRIAFHAGVLHILGENPVLAEKELRKAVTIDEEAPEGWNNLGVALYQNGRGKDARNCFERALRLLPSYSDPQNNLESPKECRCTRLPLRRHPSRSKY